MTKKDFFILIIKLFGLYSCVISLFSVLPGSISFAIADFGLISLLWIILTLVVVIGLLVLLIFKADKLVNLLKLDSGFEEDRIELGNLNSMEIVKVATFILGGIIFIRNIPVFLSQTLMVFKRDITGMVITSDQYFHWIVAGINLLIGFLLVRNYDWVAKVLAVKEKKTNSLTSQ